MGLDRNYAGVCRFYCIALLNNIIKMDVLFKPNKSIKATSPKFLEFGLHYGIQNRRNKSIMKY